MISLSRLKLIMPSNQSEERKGAMRAYGAELIDVSPEQGMEGARDLALRMQADGEGLVLNQFANPDNPGIIGIGELIQHQTLTVGLHPQG